MTATQEGHIQDIVHLAAAELPHLCRIAQPQDLTGTTETREEPIQDIVHLAAAEHPSR